MIIRRRRSLFVAVLTGLALLALLGTGMHLRGQGYRLYVVHTGSMMPTLMPGDVVLDRPADRVPVRGEIITFRHSDVVTDVVTHRVVSTNRGLIQTKGDANTSADVWDIRPNQVQGVVHTKIAKLGYLLVFLQQPAGVSSVVSGLLAMIFLWGLFEGPTDAPATARQRGAHRPSGGPRHRSSLHVAHTG
ncbi:signal peptidase I [Jatrophihabitans telluris]|uniref:Signal peptidase I n=1 Tax=Jatrophihabitans telluris TaxID=2038343 RepID=A0ABY4QZW9_9ACTN|nr:signal peptidase I [Jatrophihabitans telluris]UQX88762.1 signal peptidase I [Jatrophihabitans telluris]